MKQVVTALLPVLLLAACTQKAPDRSLSPAPPPDFPAGIYQQEPPGNVYTIDAGHSRADILVRRGGALSRMGHDHVVTAGDIQGYVLLPGGKLSGARADLRLNLNSLVVDDPATRQQYELDTRPDEEDIRKTTDNMHGKVLNTSLWPEVQLSIDVAGGTPAAVQSRVTLHMHGHVRSFPVSFRLKDDEGARLLATGAFTLRQTDFGMEPYQVMGGALRVEDELTIRFHIEALPGR